METTLITEIETIILSTIQSIYDAWGWFGVAALLTFENATGITPSEVILGLAGWMLIAEHQLHPSMIFVGGLYAALGSALGASIMYWIARLGGRPLIDKLARWVRIDPQHIHRTEKQFHKWGTGLVLMGRVMPGVRTLINIPAGLVRMTFTRFLIATFVGAYIWCTLLIGAGYVLGREWSLISTYLKDHLTYLLLGGMSVLVLYLWLNRRVLTATYAPVQTDDE